MSLFLRTDAEVSARLDRLSQAAEIALDTEFHPERTYFPRPLLIQLRPDSGEAMLVDATTVSDLRPLARMLCERPILVHGGAADIGIVQRLAGRAPAVVFDTQVVAGFVGLGFPRALRDLSASVLGKTMDKGATLTDWTRRPLSPEQLRYAAEDVLVLGPIASALRERLALSPWTAAANACMDETVARWTAPPDDLSAWKRMHSHHLSDEERGALRALAAWRENAARTADVPTHTVAADAILQDLARRRPRNLDQLRDNRRMPTGVWKTHGEAILSVLAKVGAAGEPPRTRLGLEGDLGRLAARVAEAHSGVSAELVFADCEIDYILSEKDPASWRASVLGPEWRDFVDGRRSIAMPGRWT